MSEQVLLASDLHLCRSRPAATRAFLNFLGGPATAASTLYLLGDLFEYWAGDDDLADPFNAEVCTALCRLANSGTRIRFIAGNRDFLAGEDFSRATGVEMLADGSVENVAGVATLLMHGDTLCTDDADYQRFRGEVRSPSWQRDFLARPLAERRAEIEALRRRSESEKQRKPAALMDANSNAVIAALRASGVHRLIHGHTHRPARHEISVDGVACERWVLGDWYHAGNYLLCDAVGCKPELLRC